MKPRIGITSFIDSSKAKSHFASINVNYTSAVAMAGGLPFVLPITPATIEPDTFLDGLDGLLLSGGGDIAPLRYGEEPRIGLRLISAERDDFEIALVLAARKRGVPILGICRGHQLVNVALGGSLFQDIASQVDGAIDHSPPEGQAMDELRHSIRVLPSARHMSLSIEGENVPVNSFHHQAVKVLAPGLVETACSADGVTEAFEGVGEDWLLCVQFHPEALTLRYPHFLRIFASHVDAAARYAASRG